MIVESYEDVINLSGSLEHNFWDTVHTAISLTLKRHPTGVIIDCSGITDCTPEGAETFQDILHFIQEHDARVICIGVPAPVMEVLKATPEVRSQLPLAASIDAARHSLDLLAQGQTEGKKKKEKPTEALPRIVLYVTGEERDIQGLEAGKRMALGTHSEIVLTYVIIVPRDLPLQAPLQQEEDQAFEGLKAAKEFLTARNVPFRVALERGRDVASALEQVMEEQGASVLLIPLSADPEDADADLKLIKGALHKVSTQVAFIRSAMKKG